MASVQILPVGKGYRWQETDELSNVVDGSITWDTPELAKLAYSEYLRVDLVLRVSSKVSDIADATKWSGNVLSVTK